jgi:hypothetical protein
LSIPLRNIGLGAAKELSLNWSFPIVDLVKAVNARAQRSLTPAFFEFENDILSLTSQQLHATTSMWRNQKSRFVDYLLPANSDREGVGINVPHAYILIVSALIYFSAKDGGGGLPTEIPMLRLDVEYSDVGGTRRSSAFNIELNLILAHGAEFLGYLQSRKLAAG